MVDTKERTALRDLKDVCFPRALRNTILPYPHGMALLSKRTRKCSTRCLTEPTLLEIARYPVSWLWLADYTLDGCDRPLVDASARPNSPKRPAGNDVIIWSLSLKLFPSPPAVHRSRPRAQITGRYSSKLPGAWRRRRSRSGAGTVGTPASRHQVRFDQPNGGLAFSHCWTS